MTERAHARERRDRIAKLTRQGLTVKQIADMLHCSERTVWRARTARGCNVRPPTTPMTDEEIERARLMLDDGASRQEVARTLGRHPMAIGRRFPDKRWTPEQVGRYGQQAREFNRLFQPGTGVQVQPQEKA